MGSEVGTRTCLWLALAAFALLPLGAAEAATYPAPFSEVPLAEGLEAPVAVTWAPDGRMFVAEKAGRVRVVSATGELLDDPVIDISGHVNREWDRGLVGIATDSDFEDNGFLYLLYVFEPDPPNPTSPDPRTSRLTRVVVTGENTVENPSNPETVLLGSVTTAPCPTASNAVDCMPADTIGHMVGTVRADPDGSLWVGSGDATPNVFQLSAFRTYDEQSFAGKILHVDRDGKGLAGHPFCPADTDLTHVCTKVHARGFRNPFRFSLRPGRPPLVADVGNFDYDELDVAEPGRSYGWPCYEASIHTPNYADADECDAEYAKEGTADAHLPPIHEVPNGALVGAPTYSGGDYPDSFDGSVFIGDLGGGWLRRLELNANDELIAQHDFAEEWCGVDLQTGPTGDLVYVDFCAGTVMRVDHPPDAQPPGDEENGVPAAAPGAVPLSGFSSTKVSSPRLRFNSRRGFDPRRGVLRGEVEDSSGVASVRVAMRAIGASGSARPARRCRWWSPRLGRLRKKPTACAKPLWMRARLSRRAAGKATWTLRLGGAVPAGRYAVAFRAADRQGSVTTLPARGSRVSLRVR